MISVCIAGYYCNEKQYEFFKEINQKYPVFVVAHSDDIEKTEDFLIKTGLSWNIIPNYGLEFHMYDYYIMNIWDGKSNVIFQHDDLNFHPILKNNEIITPMVGYSKLEYLFTKYDQAYVFQSQEDGYWNMWQHGRMFVMSDRLCKWFKDRGGIKFDTRNPGMTIPGSGWNYNQGIEWFQEDLTKALKEGYNVKNVAILSVVETLRRGMSHNDFLDKFGHYYKR